MAEREAVLFANEAFYRAFADGDLGTMEALWAREAPVACIHPGWNALLDRREIMESWRAILTGSARPPIQCRNARAYLYGDTALVICEEVVNENCLVATNIFVREAGAWKMVHHHAGPTASPSPAVRGRQSHRLH